VSEPRDVLFGRAEIERAFTALGDRLAGGRSVGVEGGCATVGVSVPQADRKVAVSNAKTIFALDR